MDDAISLTLSEAGYVIGQTTTAINRAVDRGVIRATLQRRGKIRLRKIGPAELRFLAISGVVARDLTPAARRKVYEGVRRLPPEAQQLDLGLMQFTLTDIDRHIAERLQRLEQVKALVDAEHGGEPILRGTTVPVHAVAALAGGQSEQEILADYPHLTSAQVEAAVEYAQIYPRPGRPLPARSLKRMLCDLAEAGIWDLANDPEPTSPHPGP